jgi:hypothetical protein
MLKILVNHNYKIKSIPNHQNQVSNQEVKKNVYMKIL